MHYNAFIANIQGTRANKETSRMLRLEVHGYSLLMSLNFEISKTRFHQIVVYFIFSLNKSRALGMRTRRRPSVDGDGSGGTGGMGGNDGSSLACRVLPPMDL